MGEKGRCGGFLSTAEGLVLEERWVCHCQDVQGMETG